MRKARSRPCVTGRALSRPRIYGTTPATRPGRAGSGHPSTPRLRNSQPLKRRRIGTRSRPGYDNTGSRVTTVGDRLNSPTPMEIALLIDGPGSSATVRYLRTPMIVGARDRKGKCEAGRQHHPAKNSNKKCVSYFFMFHFPCPFRSVYNRNSPSRRSPS